MDTPGMPAEFAEALTDVLRELSEEVEWHHEGADVVAAGPTIQTVGEAVAALEAAGYQPPDAAVRLLDTYRKIRN